MFYIVRRNLNRKRRQLRHLGTLIYLVLTRLLTPASTLKHIHTCHLSWDIHKLQSCVETKDYNLRWVCI